MLDDVEYDSSLLWHFWLAGALAEQQNIFIFRQGDGVLCLSKGHTHIPYADELMHITTIPSKVTCGPCMKELP